MTGESNSSGVVWTDVLHQKKSSTRKEKDQWLKKTNEKKAEESRNLTQPGPLDWNVGANHSNT